MSLLRDLVQEMAAGGSTGAGGIAAVPGSLFAGGVVDAEKTKQRRKKMMRRVINMKESLGIDLGRTDFDASDVVSRIDAASKKADQNDDTTAFGLEDEDGNMVKVYVRNDQSEEFEKELSALLAGELEDDEEENNALEIAEVLFKLKDKFDIVDVEWPGIEGDPEEEQEVGATAEPAADGEVPPGAAEINPDAELAGAEGAVGGDLEALDAEGGDEETMAPDEAGAETALQQVIDMMKSDAEAKKAEADARAAEARAKEAEYTAQASSGRVRKEEQMMDMENAEKAKKEEEEEAKNMAKLARYQYQKAQDAEVKLSMESEDCEDGEYDQPWKLNDEKEDEETITLKELSYLIMKNLRHN